MQSNGSKWATRFLYAAIFQGAVAAVLVFLGAFGDQIGLLPAAVSRVIASGSAGNWFTVGFTTFLIVGVVGMAATALFYYHIEGVTGKPFTGYLNWLAGAHLVLGNVGVLGAALLAMWGGYWGGRAMLSEQVGGLGWNAGQVHTNILVNYPLPISIFISLGLLGFFLGGIGYLIAMRQRTMFRART
jgi:hypothetical protein